MAGHSKWANIQHRKGRQDKLRSKLFSKLSKEITVAAKMGDPDPDKNPRLRLAVREAKSQSMPKDNIDRAIKKSQAGEGDDYEEIRYEGYGPGGVAMIVEALTDNRNRTASTVRSTFSKSGGNLGETGSVGFMFDRVGQILYPADAGDGDTVFEGPQLRRALKTLRAMKRAATRFFVRRPISMTSRPHWKHHWASRKALNSLGDHRTPIRSTSIRLGH